MTRRTVTKWFRAMTAVMIILGGVGLAFAAPPVGVQPGKKPPGTGRPPHSIKAPEIDATAGVQAIALLSGMLLLLGEGIRRRQKTKI